MVKIKRIESEIKGLNGGEYQELMDAYLFKKFKFENITRLGTEVGTSNPTKGVPDSYIENENGKYTLIMYGNVKNQSFSKIKKDIEDAFNRDKSHIDEKNIEEVICCYTSNNINIEQREELKKIFEGRKIELIGIDDLSFDIANNYQVIAKTYLNIEVDSGQIFEIDEFVDKYDKNSINAPLNVTYIERTEKQEILELLNNAELIILTGKPGVGKTKLSLEVCNEYIKNNSNFKCLCIKNNGNDIYPDLYDYIENKQDYLIFIDDINEMQRVKSVLDFFKDKKDVCNIKILATVRNYVLSNVQLKLKEYYNPEVYFINSMNDEQIKNIIESEYTIKNNRYQEKILEIANGNPRLAILASKGIIEGKINNLNSVFDIFESYYAPIINSDKLNKNDVFVLFIISLLGPINIEDDFIDKIINKFEIPKNEFIEILKKLNDYEIVDYYENKATKINDQNFGNYIIYKFLIEDKTISIGDLIKKVYPNYILKIVNAINMIFEIFYDIGIMQYINFEIKKIWNEEPYNSDPKFLAYFYNVDRIKALKIIKDEIDIEENSEIDLMQFDFDGKKNNNRIDNKKIEILSNFKHGEMVEEAIELLIRYYKKRPDLIMEFYFGFTTYLGIDEYSVENKFNIEIMIINKLRQEALNDEENRFNIYYLLMRIIEAFLKIEYHITRPTRKKGTISLGRIELMDNSETLNFRREIFKSLIELYNFLPTRQFVEKILVHYNIYPVNESYEQIFLSDAEYMIINLFNSWLEPDFIQCEILNNFYKKAKYKNLSCMHQLKKWEENDDYKIYHVLNHEREYGDKDWKKVEKERKENAIKLIKDYQVKDFEKLFEICFEFEKIREKININMWNINSSLCNIFDYLIENKVDICIQIFEKYINSGCTLLSNVDWFIKKFIDIKGKEQVFNILYNYKGKDRYSYLNYYYSNILDISKEDVTEIINLLEEQIDDKKLYVIPLIKLLNYENVLQGTIELYASKVLAKYNNNDAYINKSFLSDIANSKEEIIKSIIKSFKNIEILEDIYIIEFNEIMDYEGDLAIQIILKDKNFVLKLMTCNKNNIRNNFEFTNIFNKIWCLDNYEEYINIAVEEVSKNYFNHFEIENIFIKESNEDTEIEIRKENWINKCIEKNYLDIEYIRNIFNVVNIVFGNKKLEFIIKFIKLNKDVEIFKKIPLFPSFCSWTGSEVPLIDKRINFLEELNNNIRGIEYLEHKRYIEERIEILERSKKETKVREYLDDYIN